MKTSLPLPSLTVLTPLVAVALTVTAVSAQTPNAAAPVTAVAPAPADAFVFELGRASLDPNPATSSAYIVAATQDYRSKETGAKIRFTVREKDASGGTATHLLTINTGKYKTVAQMSEILAGVFRKYLAVVPANQEIGKVGDINHGGEIRFVAESRESLRYDWLTPGEAPHSTHFKRGDIEAFLGILTHPKAGN